MNNYTSTHHTVEPRPERKKIWKPSIIIKKCLLQDILHKIYTKFTLNEAFYDMTLFVLDIMQM